jgi:hypothetical protein
MDVAALWPADHETEVTLHCPVGVEAIDIARLAGLAGCSELRPLSLPSLASALSLQRRRQGLH